MVTLSGYEIGDCMFDGVQATLWRGSRQSDGRSVIIKVQAQERPGIKENAMFRHERDMLTRLRALPVLPLVGMEMHGRRAALVFDDPGGEFLSQRLAQRQQSLTPREALALARQISVALEQIHSGGVVHKKLSPHAIFICDDGQVQLHEFGVATALTKEERWDQPALIAETLPYISPEQTGRMNRVVDYRSDYYALGVLLFEMCTLSLPFEAEDAMGWVHCHIAKAPPKAHEREPGLSPVISALIERLMAKTAEQRYQSSRGLVADLDRCIEALDKGALDSEMVLGRVDLSGRFELAQTLFGRQGELEQLDALYARVQEHPVAIWLRLGGAAGVGKSALIMEYKRALVQRPGLLIQGKFEQYQRNVPYASMIQAFRGLIQRLLMESQEEIEQWRLKIMEALGVNVSVVLDVLPELELIVGEQPLMTALGVSERQNRFELTFQRFVALFCQPQSPLILVLDDVQWADSASVALLSALLTDPQAKHLLIITAYRDAEIDRVPGWHELEQLAQAVESLEAQRIDLGNLSEVDLAKLVSQTLGHSVEQVSDLVTVLRQKTEGNPFFIKELFTSLWEQGHIRFDVHQERWVWQIEAIQKAQMTDNVIALLSDKILRLDRQAQRVLQVAACIGGQFELETLARVCQQSEPQTAAWLWDAMQEGLLSALDDNYKYLLLEDINDGDPDDSVDVGIRGVTYRFQHDRVQQAAYSMLSSDEAAKLHLAIGRRMIASGSSSTYDRHEQLFDVVSQLNQAISLMDDSAERLGLAQLNLTAARRAKSSLAYDFARQCAAAGLECLKHLGERAWETQHELMFELSLICAQCDYLLGDFEQAQRRFEQLRGRCRLDLDRARITIDQVELLGHRNQHHEAVRLGLEGLAMLGLVLPSQPKTPSIVKEVAAVRWARRGTDSVKLMDQHEVSDERIRLAKTMILTMAASANFTSTTLFPLLVLKMTAMAIKHGHTDGSSFAYVGYGLILSVVLGDVATGRAFGELALGLSERYVAQNPSAKVRSLFVFGGIINHWSAPARSNVSFLRQCISLGLECGDLVYAGYAVTILVDSLFYAGEPLPQLEQECARQLETLSRVRDEDSMNMARATHQAVLALMGKTDAPSSLSGPGYDEAKHAEQMRESINQNPNAIYQTARVKLLVLLGDYEQAAAVAAASSSYPEGTLGLLVVPEHMVYEAIALCKCYEGSTSRERLAITRKVQSHLSKLKKWAKHSPSNFDHKVKIIEALWSQIKRDELDAPARFDEAITLAGAAQATHDEGLFAVLAYEYYLHAGRHQVALAYAQLGAQAYSRWGARALVNSLLERVSGLEAALAPGVLAQRSASNLDSAELAHVPEVESALDLATVLKATQALSSELQLEPLLRRLLSIVLENAGAQRGAVLLYDEASLCVFALAQADQSDMQTMLDDPQPLASRQDLAIKIVTYVERTQESVVLEDASLVGAFTNDPYVAAQRPRSLLCMPVVHKGSMIGALYLENNLTTGAFTQDRLEVLSVVCTQLAISIEHARMYQEVERARAGLEARVNERTQELELANHELQFEIAERKRAQAQAVEASQSKSLFLANMSHELRTPLNAIIGYSELVREDMEDMEHDEHVDDIDRILVSAHHLLNLINDILDLSKIEARKMDVLLGDVDIESLVTEVATTARPLIERNHNSFSIQTDPALIRTDKTKLTQVLVNLLSNASKFTEHGLVTLEVKTHMIDARVWVHLSVSDTGIGMSQEQLSRLFQVFSQAESDTQSKYGGTGLGLALSRQLCRLLGGDIHVTSVQGEGSTFTVVLPQYPDEETLADEASVAFEDD